MEQNVIKRAKTIKDIRMEHLHKLNRKIKKLKISKKYYKDLCKKLKSKIEKHSLKSFNDANKETSINNNIPELKEIKSRNSEKINNIILILISIIIMLF